MTIYSKYFTSGALLRRQFVLVNLPRTFSSCSIIQREYPKLGSSVKFQGCRALGPNVRYFRWDARPDNVFAHGRRLGLRAPMHFFHYLLLFGFAAIIFDWTHFIPEDPEESWIPYFFQQLMKTMNGVGSDYKIKEMSAKQRSTPSSYAGTMYDKYGDAGIDALKEAWQEVKDRGENIPDEEKILHTMMLADAKMRYKQEVAEVASELGMSEEPDVKQLLEPEKKSEECETGKGNPFVVKAEEAVEILNESLEEVEKVDKLGFRDRKIIEYENRIRQYSTPDKVFRYFATYKLTDDRGIGEVMMTPEDFLRSLSPGEKQPEHLGLDQYHQISSDAVNNMTPLKNLDESSIFYQLGAGGLISFSDYIFLLTVLSTSRRHFEIAFKMFDLNGDGTVDAEEFEKVNTLLRSTSSTGARHRDHGNTGSTFKGINSGLISYFFGDDKTGTLTVDRFLDFQLRLQEEMLALEFKRKDPSDKGRITERDFADLLIAYAGFSPKKKQKMLRRVKKSYDPETSQGISLKDYLNFYQVLYCINDIDTALTFHTIAGAPIERSTMKHVSRTVAHVDLSEHLVDVVFTLFDDNGDGMLSNKEFVSVMKQRAKRGLEKPKEIGISRVFSSLAKCAGDCRPAIMGGVKKTE